MLFAGFFVSSLSVRHNCYADVLVSDFGKMEKNLANTETDADADGDQESPANRQGFRMDADSGAAAVRTAPRDIGTLRIPAMSTGIAAIPRALCLCPQFTCDQSNGIGNSLKKIPAL